MHVEPAIAAAYYAQVPDALLTANGTSSYWGFPCNTQLFDFELQIGEGVAMIPSQFMNAGRLYGAAALPCKFLRCALFCF